MNTTKRTKPFWQVEDQDGNIVLQTRFLWRAQIAKGYMFQMIRDEIGWCAK